MKGVIIKRLNYDYWREVEVADGFDVSEEPHDLNENGEMYLAEWTDSKFEVHEGVGVSGLTLEEVKHRAEAILGQNVQWFEPLSQV